MEPILEVRYVTKVFKSGQRPDITALNGVSFCLYPGQTLGIAGESGSGKSTCAKAILHLLNLNGGSIFLHGQNITNLKAREQREVYRKIQMVFQSPMESFDPRRTIGSGIGESLRNAGWSKADTKARVIHLLGQCGLSEEYADRYPHEISGGQCQRAAIARALAIGPEILICDEATSALDVTVQQQIMDLLAHMKEVHHLSYLFISHNLALMQSCCDEILIMRRGEIVEQGPTDDVLLHPQHEYTKMLLSGILI